MQSLSPSEQRILAFAWKNFCPQQPKIDFAAVAAQAGYKNARTAQSVLAVARKKLLALTATDAPRRRPRQTRTLPAAAAGSPAPAEGAAEPTRAIEAGAAVRAQKRPADDGDGADDRRARTATEAAAAAAVEEMLGGEGLEMDISGADGQERGCADSVAEVVGDGDDAEPALLQDALAFLRGYGGREPGGQKGWMGEES